MGRSGSKKNYYLKEVIMEGLDELIKYIPYLIPVVVVQLILLVVALLDLLKREKTRGPKWVWVLVILFVNMFGPIIYFVFGRDNES
jgi:hypothetical protein